jgi:hypothetical protein
MENVKKKIITIISQVEINHIKANISFTKGLDITSRLENLSTLSPFCLYLHIHSFVQPGRRYITDIVDL